MSPLSSFNRISSERAYKPATCEMEPHKAQTTVPKEFELAVDPTPDALNSAAISC